MSLYIGAGHKNTYQTTMNDNGKHHLSVHFPAYFEYEFKIPKGCYTGLTFEYGIHTDLGTSYPVTFKVLCNDNLIFSDKKDAAEPAGRAALELPADADKLQLITGLDDSIDVTRINNIPIVPTGHAVWANPVLVKEL